MKKKYDKYGTRLFTQTIYIDLDTAEVITKAEYKKNYTTIKTKTDVQTNRNKSIKRRIIEICGTRKPQIRITFGDE